MQRRTFLQLAGASIAAGLLAGCASHEAAATRRGSPAGLDLATFHASRRFARTRYGNIAYIERGEGQVALFLHGFPLNGFQWRGVLPRLAPYRRCIAPDWLSLGHTEVAAGIAVTPQAQADMLAGFMDRLDIAQADLVANDSGGMAAQLFAVAYPGRVRSLLLTDCDTEIDSPPAAVVEVIEQARKGRFVPDNLAPQLADKSLARSANGIAGLCYSKPGSPTDEAIDCYFRPVMATPERIGLINDYCMSFAPNPLAGIEPRLRQLRVPAKILWGEAEGIFAKAAPGYLDRVLPLSHGVRMIPGAKLFFPEEYPEIVAEEARRLWGVG
ncbi:MAG TPA: alpha/beta hydrolase [Dyella sp.]|uniref:alpha/beta fold hydrolase n=1 Tax=Dyella sp. TaxID=1869338 RepID=UPI002F931514